MSVDSRLNRIFREAKRLRIHDGSKLVIISDCHRGDGSNADNYMKNQHIAAYALRRYYDEGYTYIELGDGDELWENKRFEDIAEAHGNTLEWMKRFYDEGRLYMVYGNHDMCKRNPKWTAQNLSSYIRKGCETQLFQGIIIYEGIVLEYQRPENEVLLLHGHQVDFLNYNIWRVARFLVRYFWRPLETIGVKNPSSTHVSLKKKENVEEKLINWVQSAGIPIVAGHTHRSMFPSQHKPPYFNDGCCVHPRCITAIEIAKGALSLVKWSVLTDATGSLYVARTLLAGPKRIASIWDSHAEDDIKPDCPAIAMG